MLEATCSGAVEREGTLNSRKSPDVAHAMSIGDSLQAAQPSCSLMESRAVALRPRLAAGVPFTLAVGPKLPACQGESNRAVVAVGGSYIKRESDCCMLKQSRSVRGVECTESMISGFRSGCRNVAVQEFAAASALCSRPRALPRAITVDQRQAQRTEIVSKRSEQKKGPLPRGRGPVSYAPRLLRAIDHEVWRRPVLPVCRIRTVTQRLQD